MVKIAKEEKVLPGSMMDFGMGNSVPQEKDFQSLGSWIPATPAKPTPVRPKPISGENQGNQLGGSNWLGLMEFQSGRSQETPTTRGSGMAAHFWPSGPVDLNKGPDNWESPLDWKNRDSIHPVRPHAESFRATTAEWNNIAFADLLALANGPSPSAYSNTYVRGDSLSSSSYRWIDSSQQVSSSASLLLRSQHLNRQQENSSSSLIGGQDLSFGSNQRIAYNYPSQTHQYGFPVPYHLTYDLNAPPRIATDVGSNGTISSQPAPAPQNQASKIDESQVLEKSNLGVDTRQNQEKSDKDAIAPGVDEANKHRCDDELSQLVDSSSAAILTPGDENHKPDQEGEHGIDLNKTPQQKTRRRKYTPKVVTEGKPKRTRNPATPKTKENPSGKRKYVRRKGLNVTDPPLYNAMRKAIDPNLGNDRKSCKRSLNFDLEAHAIEENNGTTVRHLEGIQVQCSSLDNASCSRTFNFNSGSEANDLCTTNVDIPGRKSTIQLRQGMQLTVEKTQAGRSYDLRQSMSQILADYMSLPEIVDYINPPATIEDPPRENLEALVRNENETEARGACQNSGENGCVHQQVHVDRIGLAFPAKDSVDNHDSTIQTMLQRCSQAAPKSQNDTNCYVNAPFSEEEQARGPKKDYCHAIGQPHCNLNPFGTHYNPLQAYQDVFQANDSNSNRATCNPYFPQIFKKKRTERGQTAITSCMSSSSKAVEDGSGGTKACSSNVINFHPSLVSDGQATLHKPQLSECMMNIGHMRRTTKKRSKGFTRVRDSASLKAIANCNQLPPTHHKKTPPSSNGQGNEISHGTQACMNALLADNLAKTTTKKRTKKGPPDSSILSGNMNAWHVQEHENFMYDYHQSSAQARSSSLGQKAIKSSTRTSLVFHINPIRGHQRSIANFRRSFESDPMEQLQKHLTPIDEIVEKLECLDINGGGDKISRKYQNALVPYSGDRTMVPYEGLFDPMKKRRPRPKVDLDPETNRVWKLLMGKESSEGIEETDQDKEKWWEDERKVFAGRTASFVARMRLVQGDRRFSPWKGSVVDSVIGVFLTQNVSDHLSSSAFMSLAARFPLKSRTNNRTHDGETIISVEDPEVCIADTIEWHEKISSRLPYDQSSVTFHEPDHTDEREVANSQESFGSNVEGLISAGNSKSKLLLFCESGLEMSNGSQEKRTETSNVGTESASFTETGYRKGAEDVSSQNSVVSPQRSIESPVIQTAERFGSCSDSNSEAEDLTVGFKTNNMESSGSFMELLQMAGNTISHERYGHGNENLSLNESSSSGQKHLDEMQSNKQRSCLNKLDLLKGSLASTYKSDPLHSHIEDPVIPSSNYCSHMTPDLGDLEVECFGAFRQEIQSYLPSNASEVTDSKDTGCMNKQIGRVAESVCEAPVQQKVMPSARKTAEVDPYASLTRHQKHPACNSQKETHTEKNPNPCSNCQGQITKIFQSEETMGADLMQNSRMQQTSNLPKFSAETLEVVETNPLSDKQESSGSTRDESNEDQMHSIGMKVNEKNTADNKKAKRRSVNADKNKGIDWDNLRKQASADGRTKERSNNTLDSVDWEAVRCADVGEISKAIKERGMNNMLAERIKDFLNRLVRDHGSIDLEWLRDVPPEKTKEYLLSVRGLGLKSVECVRLLTLHHLAFPVDTNVGRIAVRLGWVPLQPLPESLQLHLLEMYPVLESIQKYLWPRLCTLDQHSLYELHYQMITFGKVFCTKSKPNCNACPMRGECRHFASAFASARLPLPGPEEKRIVSSVAPGQDPRMVVNPLPLPLPESNPFSEAISRISNYEPIVEIPATPEPEYTEMTEADIEDAFWEDPDEIPTIKLNIEEFTQNLQNYMQQNNMELQEGGMSKALVALTPEAASIPTPKLKNVSRLRTEHQVYELPDGHSLLEGLDAREPDDPCSYLLAIWTPGETANSIEPPEKRCGSQESGGLCNDKTCFSCNSIREADSQTVRGTLLIPCRTAMRGSFPLNGTYFQVNEVFADHDSSVSPIEVPRTLIWNLPRRIVYFGTSVPTIFKGLQTEDIQKCFWKGFVCVRGFDQKTRAPRPLMARLHFPASKLTQTKVRKTNEDMMARKGT